MNLIIRTMKNAFFILFFSIAISLIACGGNDENLSTGNKDVENPQEDVSKTSTICSITPIEELNQGTPIANSHADITHRSSLMMNYRMYITPPNVDIGATYPHYTRVKKMQNGNYILFYHNGWSGGNIGRSCDYAISSDMKRWEHKGKIFKDYSIVDSDGNNNIHCYANPDAIVLSNGDILAVASYRTNSNYLHLTKDAGVELRRSQDNGMTWSDPIQIYQGITWEPYLLELPSGELHCYFTDSNRTGQEGRGRDTGTAMVVSTDGGKTWKPDFGFLPYYVIRMRWEQNGIVGYNHQMPSVICLNEGKGLAAALETNYLGKYYISLCYSDENNWKYLTPDEEGPTDHDNLKYSGMAPYIDQFPSGETVLFYNSSNKYCLRIGDATARNFGNVYQPFDGGYWGSLQVVDSHLMVGSMPKTKEGPVQMAVFVLNHRIDAVQRKVTVDGNNEEWAKTDHALFVGGTSQVQGTLRCSYDNDNIYFLVEVLDKNLLENDYATIYISPTNNSDLAEGAHRIRVSMKGMKSSETYKEAWNNNEIGAQVRTFVCDGTNKRLLDDYGYIAEISIPRSSLVISSGQLLVNFSITDKNVEEAVCDPSSTSTAHWIPVAGL